MDRKYVYLPVLSDVQRWKVIQFIIMMRLAIGAKLGHGAATGEPRAGRCQVEREDGRTSEVKSTAWRQANVIYRQ